MNSKYFFASAAVASVLACTSPARAQVLGGGLSGAVSGTLSGGLSGMGGLGGVGGITSTATGTARDLNSIGRATTQHAHDTVSATADASDRAAANVDKQVKSTDVAASATANAASSANSNVAADAAKSKRIAKPVKSPGTPSDQDLLAVGSLDGSVNGALHGSLNDAPTPALNKDPAPVKNEPVKASHANTSARGSASSSAQGGLSAER